MPALKYDLIVEQGADYELTIPVLGLAEGDMVTGWAATGQIRASYGNAAVLHTLTVVPTGSTVVLRIPAATSAAWPFRLARYDIELTAPDGVVSRLLEGSVVVHPEVTRPV